MFSARGHESSPTPRSVPDTTGAVLDDSNLDIVMDVRGYRNLPSKFHDSRICLGLASHGERVLESCFEQVSRKFQVSCAPRTTPTFTARTSTCQPAARARGVDLRHNSTFVESSRCVCCLKGNPRARRFKSPPAALFDTYEPDH